MAGQRRKALGIFHLGQRHQCKIRISLENNINANAKNSIQNTGKCSRRKSV
jgi:hypothetical protein